MLKPKIQVTQNSGECGYLRIRDITGDYSDSNKGGYGGLNIAADKITSIDFIIKHNGTSYLVDKGLLPGGEVMVSLLDLTEEVKESTCKDCTDCTDYELDCGCGKKKTPNVDCITSATPVPDFSDGCIYIQTRMWSNCLRIETRCNYKMSTSSSLLGFQRLYVEHNGVMTLVMPTIIGNSISFMKSGTSDVYGRWELRDKDSNVIDQAGMLQKTECMDYEVEGELRPYAINNQQFVSTCAINKKIKKIVLSSIIEDNCKDKPNNNSIIALIISRLSFLTGGCGTDCKCIESKIEVMNRQLDRL